MLKSQCVKSRNVSDALERAFDIVAENIGSDWSRLYRTLAFFPVRGRDNLDADINDIVQVSRVKQESLSRAVIKRSNIAWYFIQYYTKCTPFLAIMGELWGVYIVGIYLENWPRRALYQCFRSPLFQLKALHLF